MVRCLSDLPASHPVSVESEDRCGRASAGLKIFCFPHAGGGPSTFRSWRSGLPQGCTVVPISLPGRESRFSSTIPGSIDALLTDAASQVFESLSGSFAIFGHSLGALLAFEFARHLRRQGLPGPVHLFVSGFRAPQLPRRGTKLSCLSDSDLQKAILRFRGTSHVILQESELVQLLLPVFRADLRLCDEYRWKAEPPLDCPISAFAGLADAHVRPEEVSAWRVQTRAEFRFHLVPGGHFFPFEESRRILWAKLLADLDFRRTFGRRPPAV